MILWHAASALTGIFLANIVFSIGTSIRISLIEPIGHSNRAWSGLEAMVFISLIATAFVSGYWLIIKVVRVQRLIVKMWSLMLVLVLGIAGYMPLLTSQARISDMKLTLALVDRDEAAISSALQEGANPNAIFYFGTTPIITKGIEEGDLFYVETLLRHGANVNIADNLGRTPLHRAIEYGRPGVAELLIKNGADLNIRDRNGRTPLDYVKHIHIEHDEEGRLRDKFAQILNGDTTEP